MNQHSPLLAAGLLAIFAGLPAPALAGECSAVSGINQVALLELYTSEGCSSCPPADRWLGRLTAQGFSSDRLVPLALHVDYWDYIGWRDRFARPDLSARQRELATLNRSSAVYTPQVMLNGKSFRGWTSASAFENAIAAVNRAPARATIRLELQRTADTLRVSASAGASLQEKPALYVALHENDLSTTVEAGENNGATLHHDHVVREWLGPYAIDGNLSLSKRLTIPLRAGWKTQNLGIAAFVQNRSSGEILQAVSLNLCG